MPNRLLPSIVLIAVVLLSCWGCSGGDGDSSTQTATTATTQTTGQINPPAPVPQYPVMPEVALSEAAEEECRGIREGKPMPEIELADLEGASQSLHGLFGETLTVVLFWQSGEESYDRTDAEDALWYLGEKIAGPLGERGVRVVSINVGDSAEVAGERLAAAEVSLPTLLDSDRELFSQVATTELPRVYLLDPEGVILWFDPEFSETSRDHLLMGIGSVLKENLEQ